MFNNWKLWIPVQFYTYSYCGQELISTVAAVGVWLSRQRPVLVRSCVSLRAWQFQLFLALCISWGTLFFFFLMWTLQQLFEVTRVTLGPELFCIEWKLDEVRLSNLFNCNQWEIKLSLVVPIPSFSIFWNKGWCSPIRYFQSDREKMWKWCTQVDWSSGWGCGQ